MSLDEGRSWKPVNVGLPQQPFLYAFARLGDTLFAGGTGAYGGSTLFKASVQDFRWTHADLGPPIGVRTVQRILATEHGLFRSEDLGDHWSAPSGDPPREELYSLAASGKEIYAGSGHGGLSVSMDYGCSWMSISLGLR